MEPSELLDSVARSLDRMGIEYFVTGSMASIAYGEPRFTNDIDIVIRIDASDVARLCAAFPEPDFYVSPEAARAAMAQHAQFNVIHPSSGLKIDFMVAAPDEFNRNRFERARSVEVVPNSTVRMATPEDVILRKLQYFKEGGSDKHIRDIAGILRVSGPDLDLAYIDAWTRRLGVEQEWAHVER